MKGLIYSGARHAILLFVAAAFFSSCKKDEVFGRINLESSILVLDRLGATSTVDFTTSNVRSLTVTGIPDGWRAEADLSAGVLTVTAPETIDEGSVRTGSVVLSGTSIGGGSVSATLAVGVYNTVNLVMQPSNCYLIPIKEPETETDKEAVYYLINGVQPGEGGVPLSTASAELIWQTAGTPIQYVEFREGTISFLVNTDDDGKLMAGNALIGAYDASGVLLWSWHIWVTDYDPEEEALTYSNGYTVMSRNLGAQNNANATQEEILESYGMYYQWGRKEPFVGPSSYNAAQGVNAAIYNAKGSRIYLTEVESSARTGTAEYALRNPLSFILGIEDSGYDWLYAAHDANRWGDSKTINDPCPRGWKVASPRVFEGLAIADKTGDAADLAEAYGWELTDGGVTSLYMGLGRRTYLTGRIQNTYNPLVRNTAVEAQPWEGFYWTTAADADLSDAFYFYFNKRDVADSGVETRTAHYRANGMQVRCVKDE